MRKTASGIQATHLTKRFGSVLALDDVSLTFEAGKIYGLLGRNGAGKSTLLNLITDRLFPDAGSVTIDGEPNHENDRALRCVYLMSEKSYYPETIKVSNLFKWTAAFHPAFDLQRALALAKQFELPLDKKVKALSTGYASIFKVVIALSLDLPYIFLDEPVLGLDAHHRELFYRLLLARYSEEPRTFVLSTHLIEELIIIKRGKLLCAQSCESLLAAGYSVSGRADAVDGYAQGRRVIAVDQLGALKTAHIMGERDLQQIAAAQLEVSRLDLQKLFIQLTNPDHTDFSTTAASERMREGA